MKKIVSFGIAVPVAITAALGIASSASAQLFSNGDQLNVDFDAVQFNAAGFPGLFPALPTGEPNGGADGDIDVLFGELATDYPLSASNRVFNYSPGDDAEIGEVGEFGVGNSSGAFAGLVGETGTITNVDGDDFPGGFDFASVGNFEFSFESVETFAINPFQAGGVPGFGSLPGIGIDSVPAGTLFLEASGFVIDTVSGETAPITYQFTAQGIRDDGLAGDAVANDGVTNVTTQSASGLVTVEAVPEPTSVVSLALLGLGFLGSRKKLLKKN
ncbi:MAG: PEP-CTERM sorting domain-containing protein [Cyanophyceae cyanobacterium]